MAVQSERNYRTSVIVEVLLCSGKCAQRSGFSEATIHHRISHAISACSIVEQAYLGLLSAHLEQSRCTIQHESSSKAEFQSLEAPWQLSFEFR